MARRDEESEGVTDDARGRIVVAARDLFAERGFDSVSVRDIAERAGVTHGLLRHHFGGKDGVWRAVVEAADRTYGQSLMPVLRRAAVGTDPVGDTKALVRAVIDVSARHPHFVKLLMAEGFADGPRLRQILAGLRPLQDATAALLSRLHERGRLRQFDGPSFTLFLLLTGAGPFALSALAQGLRGTGTAAPPLTAEAHATSVLATLFGP
jgi:AcrR family transcriptional regulator